MLNFYKRYYKTAFDIALIFITVYLFMFLFSYLYKIATPIFLSLLIFVIIEPFARFLNRKGFKKSIATAISMLLFIAIILALLVGLGAIFTNQIINLVHKIPAYQEILQDNLASNAELLREKYNALPENMTEKIKEYSQTVTEYGSKIALNFLNFLINGLTSFSSFVVNFTIGTILAYFLSIEIELWRKIAKKKTPATFKKAFEFMRVNVIAGIGGYLKAQLKLISITFIVIYIALLVLGVKNAFSISVLSAIFDILPLLGVSTVFIPWIIYLFVVGDMMLAIWLSVLLGAVILVRQILEPKITGDTLGVSAFTMLSFMIISLSIFGIAGLILSPILIITLKALNNEGYIRQWIRLPEDEFDPDPEPDDELDADPEPNTDSKPDADANSAAR